MQNASRLCVYTVDALIDRDPAMRMCRRGTGVVTLAAPFLRIEALQQEMSHGHCGLVYVPQRDQSHKGRRLLFVDRTGSSQV